MALDTFLEIQDRVLSIAGLSSTSDRAHAKSVINEVAREIVFDHDWSYRKKVGYIQTLTPYSTGTIDVTEDSDTVTGNGTAWNTGGNASSGMKLALSYGAPWYYISVGGDTAITLTRNYEEADGSAVSYVIYQDEYAVDTSAQQVRIERVYFHEDSTECLTKVTQQEMEDLFATPDHSGRPTTFCVIEDSSTAVVTIRLHPVPDQHYHLRYGYLDGYTALSADADEPAWPDHMGTVVLYKAVSRFMLEHLHFEGSGRWMQFDAMYQTELAKAKARDRRARPAFYPIRPRDLPRSTLPFPVPIPE